MTCTELGKYYYMLAARLTLILFVSAKNTELVYHEQLTEFCA